jgi:hypothetical protein
MCVVAPILTRANGLLCRSESMRVTIGYLEAWRLWFSGQQPPSDAVLWFMSLRWWARAGKLAAFVGGATVILDLIGPERLRQFGQTRQQVHLFRQNMFVVITGGLAFIGLFVLIGVSIMTGYDTSTLIVQDGLVMLFLGTMSGIGVFLVKKPSDPSRI